MACAHSLNMRSLINILGCLALAALLAGCGQKAPSDIAALPPSAPAKHHHDPPHGGTGVELGEEDFHLEFLRDGATGRMRVYVLSAHMEGFVRLPLESFEVAATVGGKQETLVFKAVANTATGETVGDSAQFETQADWLKETKTFDAVLKEITIRGKSYKSVKFNFPRGND